MNDLQQRSVQEWLVKSEIPIPVLIPARVDDLLLQIRQFGVIKPAWDYI